MAIDRARIDEIRSRYEDLAQVMDERVTRLWAAGEAKSLGRGGIAAVTEATGILGKRIRYVPNLNATIQSLAQKFAAELVTAVRGMSLEEVLGESAAPTLTRSKSSTASKLSKSPTLRGPGRPPKVTVDAIVGVLKQHKEGLRSQNLRKALGGVQKGAWRYVIVKALAEKKISMRGTKNTAVYFAR